MINICKNDTNLVSRLKQHGREGDNTPREAWDELNASDIYYTELYDANMADFVESELIRWHKPKWNRAKKTKQWSGLPIGEPEWTLFVPEKKEVKNPYKNVPKYMLPPYTASKFHSIMLLFICCVNNWITLRILDSSKNQLRFVNTNYFREHHEVLAVRIKSEFFSPILSQVYSPTYGRAIEYYTGTISSFGEGFDLIIYKETYDKTYIYYQECIKKIEEQINELINVIKKGYPERLDDTKNSFKETKTSRNFQRTYKLYLQFKDYPITSDMFTVL